MFTLSQKTHAVTPGNKIWIDAHKCLPYHRKHMLEPLEIKYELMPINVYLITENTCWNPWKQNLNFWLLWIWLLSDYVKMKEMCNCSLIWLKFKQSTLSQFDQTPQHLCGQHHWPLPVWILVWSFRLDILEKAEPHSMHTWGFSPEDKYKLDNIIIYTLLRVIIYHLSGNHSISHIHSMEPSKPVQSTI